MPLHGVIFDLGSTLIHRTGLELEKDKCGALARFAGAELGCRDPNALASSLLELRLAGWKRSDAELVEVPGTASITKAFERLGLPTDARTLARAEAVFFEPEVRISRLYPGAIETLEAVRAMGLRLGMISNATSHSLILSITDKHRIGAYFHPLVTSDGFGHVKPYPGIFTHVLEAWGMAPDSAVMIGDTLRADIAGAHAVGMRSILVDIEPNPENPAFAETTVPTARVEALHEIPPLIRRWAGA